LYRWAVLRRHGVAMSKASKLNKNLIQLHLTYAHAIQGECVAHHEDDGRCHIVTPDLWSIELPKDHADQAQFVAAAVSNYADALLEIVRLREALGSGTK
jgi:hypothetical protein